MTYVEAMEFLSQFDLGAVLVSQDDFILEVNQAADRMLHGNGSLKGCSFREIAPDFCKEDLNTYFNIAFSEYLALCPSPKGVELPTNTHLVCFRDASKEIYHHMMQTIVNLVPEPTILADEKQRIMLINDATMRMENLMQEDVVGRDITEVYREPNSLMSDGEDVPELTVPYVLRTKKPVRDCHQVYTTCQGKRLDIMCNSYPIFKDDKILGVFCLTADSTRISALSQQILDLQEMLLNQDSTAKSPRNVKKTVLSAKYNFQDIIHQSTAMREMIEKCKMSAKSDSPIMLFGETGTGKELVAQSIHNASNRADGPFLAINCAAIPENLLESMLFGTEKGAYTGAERRAGLFEQADGGTLLLDELNSMSMILQAKLLRVLQDGMVRRVGGTEERRVDVRVLSNTNVPPYQAIAEGKMRQDVYYRLGVVNINIPPLRQRKEDIPILTRSFFLRMNKKLGKSVAHINEEVMSIFYAYHWPGNVRELQHCIEHAMNILPNTETVIKKEYLPEHILAASGGKTTSLELGEEAGLEAVLSNVERGLLADALQKNKGNISKAARQLGISRQNLQHRMKRNELDLETILSGEEE